jgi:nicotinate-nucleotide pyrophosphorylase (carboxylating)
MNLPAYVNNLAEVVALALAEDIGSGDVTALLADPDKISQGRVITREAATVCGVAWVNEVFRQVDARIALEWRVEDGQRVQANDVLFRFSGPARGLLTAERSALNFLQTLSGTATVVRQAMDVLVGTDTQVVDTRKTLPCLRNGQKYAVLCGGGANHRIGLYDGILIKENHIAAAGGIAAAIQQARALNAGVPLMTEAETLAELAVALQENVELVLVDEFALDDLREAVRQTRAHRASGGQTLIEYSGNVTLQTLRQYADCGVDRISMGGLTKHVRAVDLSMRFV